MSERFSSNSEHGKKQRHSFRPVEFFGKAVTVAPGELFVPTRGFKVSEYRPRRSELESRPESLSVYTIAVEQARAFELFLDLLAPLGEECSVIFESSHLSTGNGTVGLETYLAESNDHIALRSSLLEYRTLFAEDGCAGITVLDDREQCEVTYNEDKLLYCYGHPGIMGSFQKILHQHGVMHEPTMKTVSQVLHIHRTTNEYRRLFQELVLNMTGSMPDHWDEQHQ